MSLVESMHPRLRTASIVVVGVVASMMAVLVWGASDELLGGHRRIVYRLLPGLILPTVYVWTALQLRRGRYAAMLVLMVLPAWELIVTLLSLTFTWRFYAGMMTPWFLVAPVQAIVLLAMGIWSRPALLQNADLPAVERARRRTVIGLRIAAVVMILEAIALVVVTVYYADQFSGRDRWYAAIPVGTAVALFVGAMLSLRLARRSAGRETPTVLALVFTILFGVLGFLVARMAVSLVLVQFRADLTQRILDMIVCGLAAGLLVDLLHARRICEEPQSYGFAPIFAQPVQPIAPEDANRFTQPPR